MVKDELIWQEERCHFEEVARSDCMEFPCSLRDALWCSRSAGSLKGTAWTASPAEFLDIATGLDPEGLCAPPFGEQLAPVLSPLNGLIRAMATHGGEVPVGRGLLALVPRGRSALTGVEGDDSPWVRAFSALGTASVFLIERAANDLCHLVRLAATLNPGCPERALDQLAKDRCAQVSALALHLLRRDRSVRDSSRSEPTAFLQRLRPCLCSDDCGSEHGSSIAELPFEVSESALDILFRFVEGSGFRGTIRPTGCGIGPGWAFGVFATAVAGEPLLLVDHSGRVALPDAVEWHELAVDEAVGWVAHRAGVALTDPVTPLRTAILVDRATSPLGSTILRVAHLLASREVVAALRPLRVDGLAYEPHDPVHDVGATSHWVIEVVVRQSGHGLHGPAFLSRKALFDLGPSRDELRAFLGEIIDAIDRIDRSDAPIWASADAWRRDPIPLLIDHAVITSLDVVEGGVVIESVLDPARRWHAFGAYFASASDPDRQPIIKVDGGPMCGLGLPRDLLLVAENGEELDEKLGIGGSEECTSWAVTLEELPVRSPGIGVFIRTPGGWFIVRDVLGEDGRWMSGYRQTLNRRVAVELAAFRESTGDVRVPAPTSSRHGSSSAPERWGIAEEIVSFVGDPFDPYVTGFRYEFAIGGLIDAERRGWAWTRCDADWRDCSMSDDGRVHGCLVPSDGLRRNVVQPWALHDLVRIWDGSGRVPTALAVLASRAGDAGLSSSEIGEGDRELLRRLLRAVPDADAAESEFDVLMRLADGHDGVLVTDAFQQFVRLLEG